MSSDAGVLVVGVIDFWCFCYSSGYDNWILMLLLQFWVRVMNFDVYITLMGTINEIWWSYHSSRYD